MAALHHDFIFISPGQQCLKSFRNFNSGKSNLRERSAHSLPLFKNLKLAQVVLWTCPSVQLYWSSSLLLVHSTLYTVQCIPHVVQSLWLRSDLRYLIYLSSFPGCPPPPPQRFCDTPTNLTDLWFPCVCRLFPVLYHPSPSSSSSFVLLQMHVLFVCICAFSYYKILNEQPHLFIV